MNKPHPASYAWGGMILYVIVADAALIKGKRLTMSSIFRQAIEHPTRRWMVSASWALLTFHLFANVKYDPISMAGRWLAEKDMTS